MVVNDKLSGARGLYAGEYLKQGALTVACDAGYADNLAAFDGKADIIDARQSTVIGHRQVAYVDAELAIGFFHFSEVLGFEFATNHQLGQFCGTGVSGAMRGDNFTEPQYRYAIGDIHNFAQLMGD